MAEKIMIMLGEEKYDGVFETIGGVLEFSLDPLSLHFEEIMGWTPQGGPSDQVLEKSFHQMLEMLKGSSSDGLDTKEFAAIRVAQMVSEIHYGDPRGIVVFRNKVYRKSG